jgi:hypothetical protein
MSANTENTSSDSMSNLDYQSGLIAVPANLADSVLSSPLRLLRLRSNLPTRRNLFGSSPVDASPSSSSATSSDVTEKKVVAGSRFATPEKKEKNPVDIRYVTPEKMLKNREESLLRWHRCSRFKAAAYKKKNAKAIARAAEMERLERVAAEKEWSDRRNYRNSINPHPIGTEEFKKVTPAERRVMLINYYEVYNKLELDDVLEHHKVNARKMTKKESDMCEDPVNYMYQCSDTLLLIESYLDLFDTRNMMICSKFMMQSINYPVVSTSHHECKIDMEVRFQPTLQMLDHYFRRMIDDHTVELTQVAACHDNGQWYNAFVVNIEDSENPDNTCLITYCQVENTQTTARYCSILAKDIGNRIIFDDTKLSFEHPPNKLKITSTRANFELPYRPSFHPHSYYPMMLDDDGSFKRSRGRFTIPSNWIYPIGIPHLDYFSVGTKHLVEFHRPQNPLAIRLEKQNGIAYDLGDFYQEILDEMHQDTQDLEDLRVALTNQLGNLLRLPIGGCGRPGCVDCEPPIEVIEQIN